jgi:adenylosuccinate synthase
MANEKPLHLFNSEHETNIYNKFQLNFRTGDVDLDLLDYAITCDQTNFNEEYNKHLVVTCDDQLESTIETIGNHEFKTEWLSFGEETDLIQEMK